MAKAVGFSRTIKPQWLKKTMELVNAGKTVDEMKAELDDYLSFELSDKTNISKARNILINIWGRENSLSAPIREEAIRLYNKDCDNELPLSWCMMLMAYPVFTDLCKLIGKLSEFEEEFSVKQLKQKLYDEWGETSTLMYSIEKLVSTLKNLGVLENVKSGIYRISKHRVMNSEVTNFLLYTMMKVDDAGYYSFVEAQESVYLFPFIYKVSKEAIMQDERFDVNMFGGELSISIKES